MVVPLVAVDRITGSVLASFFIIFFFFSFFFFFFFFLLIIINGFIESLFTSQRLGVVQRRRDREIFDICDLLGEVEGRPPSLCVCLWVCECVSV